MRGWTFVATGTCRQRRCEKNPRRNGVTTQDDCRSGKTPALTFVLGPVRSWRRIGVDDGRAGHPATAAASRRSRRTNRISRRSIQGHGAPAKPSVRALAFVNARWANDLASVVAPHVDLGFGRGRLVQDPQARERPSQHGTPAALELPRRAGASTSRIFARTSFHETRAARCSCVGHHHNQTTLCAAAHLDGTPRVTHCVGSIVTNASLFLWRPHR